MGNSAYLPNEAAKAASDYFNSLPREERAKLAPLLENYRQMGMAEALGHFDLAAGRVNSRIRGIRDVPNLAATLEQTKERSRAS